MSQHGTSGIERDHNSNGRGIRIVSFFTNTIYSSFKAKAMRVMSLTSIVCTVSFLLLTACHKEDKDHDIPPSKYDRNFMIDASRANLAEVAAGEIAVKRGTDADVRAFGAKMVTEHKKAQEDLLKLADKWDIDLPDEPDSTHIMIAKKLMTLS